MKPLTLGTRHVWALMFLWGMNQWWNHYYDLLIIIFRDRKDDSHDSRKREVRIAHYCLLVSTVDSSYIESWQIFRELMALFQLLSLFLELLSILWVAKHCKVGEEERVSFSFTGLLEVSLCLSVRVWHFIFSDIYFLLSTLFRWNKSNNEVYFSI